ncbi:hypothetical protein PACILC2_44550 [Paenibacillus cisolokensis]|uniref:Uncharacterized protein n=1 Tax=Paenibacillus cisolokensis TaxID=1658519 RepID=A0ABQ4NCE9_9BACL|nr:hypothetical protein [Paenibacillus cisolokensis]GIQ65887.1 hypothetical protein PACILC2_44550 [Paenibacillus cisolokensis]
MVTINVTINFNPEDETEFENILYSFEDSKVDFLKWVHLLCAGTKWEAAFVLADEFIRNDNDLKKFINDYYNGSANADDIFDDLQRFVDGEYVLN